MSDERIIVGLDIGTTKICTVIGEVASDGVLDIIGEGTVPSDGMRKGVVVNLERTIAAVRQSVAAAQRVAGVDVSSAWVGVAGTHLKALTSHGMSAIRRGYDVTRTDVERTIENARAIPMEANMEILHVIPQEYVVDGNDGIKDPIGMSGVRLEIDVHIVAGAQGPLQNLRRCATDADVLVDGLVVQALASGLAVLNHGEQELTTLLIDIGGGTTDVGVFRRGTLAHSAVIPLGGDHITQDISQLLRIPPDEAERVKRRYGVALPELADRDVELEVANPNYTASISTFELAQVIKPRVVELLDFVRRDIEHAGLDDLRQLEGGDGGGVVGVGHFEFNVAVRQLGQGHAVTALHALRLVGRDAQELADVLGDVVAAQRDDGGVSERAAAEDAHVRGAAADVYEQRGELLLAVVQHGQAGGQRLDHQAVHRHVRVGGAAPEVLQGALRPRHYVHVDLEAHAGHADGVLDAVVAVHHVLLRDDVEDLHVGFHGHGAGVLYRALHVGAGDVVAAPDGGHAVAGERLEVRAGHAHPGGAHVHTRHALRRRHRLPHGGDGALQVDDHALAHAVGRDGALTDDVQHAVRGHLADHCADLRGPDVEADDDSFVTH